MTAAFTDPVMPPERPPAIRRRGWRTDIRFVIGVVLILASVAGVWAVLTAARRTSPVYAAAHTLVAGQPVTAGDLTVVEAGLGVASKVYLTDPRALEGVVAARTVPAGEFVPADALVPAEQAATTTVVVRSAVDVPRVVAPGSVVELWAAEQTERGVYGTPHILVAGATVASVSREDSMVGARAATLELVIPHADVAAALHAVAADAALSVVPAAGER